MWKMSEMLVKDSYRKTDFIQKELLEEGLQLGREVGRHNTECKKIGVYSQRIGRGWGRWEWLAGY